MQHSRKRWGSKEPPRSEHKWRSKVSEPKFYNVAFRQKDTPLDSFIFLFAVWKKSCVKKQLEQVFHQLQEKILLWVMHLHNLEFKQISVPQAHDTSIELAICLMI